MRNGEFWGVCSKTFMLLLNYTKEATEKVPIISMFFGIIIRMLADDHNPPHFHAQYGDFNATFSFDGKIIKGEMPARQLKFIVAWAEIHRAELEANWLISLESEQPYKIEPLR